MSMINRFLVVLLSAASLSSAAHAAFRVTAFDGAPGFEGIMSADYEAARKALSSQTYASDRYARYANLCVSLLKSGDVDAALSKCERALVVAPADLTSSLLPMYHKRSEVLTHLYSNRGVVRAMTGDVAGARADFERALSLDESNVNARRNLEHMASNDLALLND